MEKRVVIDLPAELWRNVGIAAAMEGKTKKEYVAESLHIKLLNGGGVYYEKTKN